MDGEPVYPTIIIAKGGGKDSKNLSRPIPLRIAYGKEGERKEKFLPATHLGSASIMRRGGAE